MKKIGFFRNSNLNGESAAFRYMVAWGQFQTIAVLRPIAQFFSGRRIHDSQQCIKGCGHVDIITGWWFGTFFFPYIGNNHPH